MSRQQPMDERVRRWSASVHGVSVDTMSSTYTADRLVVAAGPWLPNLIDSLSVVLPLEIERQLSHWFSPTQRDARYEPERCPIGLWELAGEVFATFPDMAHMHNFADTREQLWQALDDWLPRRR